MLTYDACRPAFGARGTAFCALAVAVVFAPSTASCQIVMSLPTGLTAHPGDTITLPANLNIVGTQLDGTHGNGIGADSFVISYNTNLASSIGTTSLGTLISNPSYGFSNYTTNNAAGLIRDVTSSGAGTPGLPAATSGTLASILFSVSSSATPGTYTISLLPSSGSTTTSVVDNNFNTYDSSSGLTLVNGSLIVSPVPEPSSFLLIAVTAATGALFRRRASRADRGLSERPSIRTYASSWKQIAATIRRHRTPLQLTCPSREC